MIKRKINQGKYIDLTQSYSPDIEKYRKEQKVLNRVRNPSLKQKTLNIKKNVKSKKLQRVYNFQTASPVKRIFDSPRTSMKRKGLTNMEIRARMVNYKRSESIRRQRKKALNRGLRSVVGMGF